MEITRIRRTPNPIKLGSANMGLIVMVIPIPYRRKTGERLQGTHMNFV
jgi:hypothetical protein